MMKKLTAEFVGTFWLVFGGCGSAVLAAAFPELGIGFVGVSLAFGLTVLTMAYAIGHISGCHLNPAVSVGLAVGGRFPAAELPAYIVAQVLGGLVNPTSASVASNVDRRAAITDAVRGADVNDVVLVAGKGHETYQEIGGQRHDFDDWQVCQQAIAAREVSA